MYVGFKALAMHWLRLTQVVLKQLDHLLVNPLTERAFTQIHCFFV